ncbi:hypothetical protein V8C34DRAFT_49755 [Trichoderma compactum]
MIGSLEDGGETADSQRKTLLDVVSMFQCHADAGVKGSDSSWSTRKMSLCKRAWGIQCIC